MLPHHHTDAPIFYRVLLSVAVGRVVDLSPATNIEAILSTLPRLQRVPPDLRLAFDLAMVDLYVAECDRGEL